jgi:hypothetical protein
VCSNKAYKVRSANMFGQQQCPGGKDDTVAAAAAEAAAAACCCSWHTGGRLGESHATSSLYPRYCASPSRYS